MKGWITRSSEWATDADARAARGRRQCCRYALCSESIVGDARSQLAPHTDIIHSSEDGRRHRCNGRDQILPTLVEPRWPWIIQTSAWRCWHSDQRTRHNVSGATQYVVALVCPRHTCRALALSISSICIYPCSFSSSISSDIIATWTGKALTRRRTNNFCDIFHLWSWTLTYEIDLGLHVRWQWRNFFNFFITVSMPAVFCHDEGKLW